MPPSGTKRRLAVLNICRACVMTTLRRDLFALCPISCRQTTHQSGTTGGLQQPISPQPSLSLMRDRRSSVCIRCSLSVDSLSVPGVCVGRPVLVVLPRAYLPGHFLSGFLL
jgi:hypothetical protein